MLQKIMVIVSIGISKCSDSFINASYYILITST